MSGNGKPAEAEAQAERRPRIVIEFDAVNGAECAIRPDGDVSTGQLYLAAWLLDAFAHETRTGERAMIAAQASPLIVPRGHLAPHGVPRS